MTRDLTPDLYTNRLYHSILPKAPPSCFLKEIWIKKGMITRLSLFNI